mmetsp:Transcript_67970/g.145519  ORF Transcript_67970/g.145519 Transcript_67970/m.145519 type:complete len:157 (-) Transcript_67970:445-915(-)
MDSHGAGSLCTNDRDAQAGDTNDFDTSRIRSWPTVGAEPAATPLADSGSHVRCNAIGHAADTPRKLCGDAEPLSSMLGLGGYADDTYAATATHSTGADALHGASSSPTDDSSVVLCSACACTADDTGVAVDACADDSGAVLRNAADDTASVAVACQ